MDIVVRQDDLGASEVRSLVAEIKSMRMRAPFAHYTATEFDVFMVKQLA